MSRLTELVAKIEKGEPVDLQRVSLLLALDAVVADERFVAEMATIRDQADEQLATAFGH